MPTITIVVLVVIVSALGYFLFRTSPSSPANSVQSAGSVVQNNDMSGHHGGGTSVPNNEVLNSLIGKPMPDIRLSDKDGKAYSAADFKGKNTVLFFNEGLMCYPACWNQIAAFGNDVRFNSADTAAISIVVDSVKDWQTAIAKMPPLAKATTMFDANAAASRQFGILTTTSSMHKGSLPGHTYIVLDKDAVVRYVFDDPNMAIANDMLFNKIGALQ